MKINRVAVSLIAAGVMATPFAYATNGMNLEGYGPVAEAMGGASMAYDNGTAAVMNNPATLALMPEGRRADVALGVLGPQITTSVPGASVDSTATAFYMPAVGYAHKTGKTTYGVGVFSQGGMGTEYAANSFMAAGSGEKVRSEVGVGRFILPVAYQVDDKFTVAGSLDYVWAGMDLKMALTGAQFGDMVSGVPGAPNVNGTQTYGSASGSLVNILGGGFQSGGLTGVNWARVDFSNSSAFSGQAKGSGLAFKLGGLYKVNSQLTLGATYHSPTALDDLSTAVGGSAMTMSVNGPGVGGTAIIPVTGQITVHNFQWPQTIAVGAAYQVTDQFLLVADYKNIGWKDAMKNFSVTFIADATQANPLATGFGMGGKIVDMTMYQNWSNQNVFELGGAYKLSDLTLRAGVNIANNPVPDSYMNPLFPAIAQSHATLGVGYEFSKVSSVDFSYVYVPKVSQTNDQGATVDFGGYSAQLMYSHKY